ncbi:hypothetical protein CRG98_003532 [Punica granatum]|uniref:Uncharacterized protein n=1 Tax=Punica granatum TaxID=22663 RepID=A0A2I0L620_PUNGR|nr:hypothetical protein CRG98_003532 [Punica granatum]
MSKNIVVLILVLFMATREFGLGVAQFEPVCTEALPIHGDKCLHKDCDDDCKKKHGPSGDGTCMMYTRPDDTCRCVWDCRTPPTTV